MGAIFGKLMKTGVQTPNGQTSYFDNPGKAIASASATTAQPGTSSITGPGGGAPQIPLPTITSTQVGDTPAGGIGPMQSPDVTVTPGQDNTTVSQNDAPIGSQPRTVKPTWQQAVQGGPFSDQLSRKGQILDLLINMVNGAGAGYAAASQGTPRTGYPGAGVGFAAGMQLPFQQAQQRNALAEEALQQQKTQAEIAALPQQQAAVRAHLAAQTALANAGAARKDTYVIPNVGLVSSDGSVIVPEPSLSQKSQQILAVKQQEAKAAGLDPEETKQYVFGIKPSTSQNVDQQELQDWMQKNPGKGPADFLKYKSTMVPQFNFNLQQGGVGGGSGFAPGTSPEDMYKSFGAKSGIIRGIVEGRQSPPSAFAQKTPYWQDVMQKVYQVDPQWNEQTAQLRKSYSSGKQSAEINSIKTAMGHVGVLGDSIAALNNGDVKALNGIANQLGVQFGSTPVTTFNTIVNRVGPELSKAYIGAGGSAGERGADAKDFDPSLGPKQLTANVAITARLLRSKIGSLENQWNQNAAPGMKSFQDQFITPEAKAALNKYSPQGGGVQVTAPDGSVHTFADQASASAFKRLAGIQ